MEKVSIIIPTFNRSTLLKKAVLSALEQTYPNLEILVFDNNSIDDTEEVIKTISHPTVKYFRNNENIGPILNWRKGLEMASGEYGVFLCDDDEFHDKDYIKIAVSVLKENKNISIVIPSVIIKKGGTSTFNGFKESAFISGKDFLFNFWTKQYIIPSISNVFNISAVKKLHVLYDNNILMSDIELWLIMMIFGDVYCLNLPCVTYNFHENNIVLNMHNKHHIQNAAFIKNVINNSLNQFEREYCSALHFNLLKRFILFSSRLNGFFIDYKTFRAIAENAGFSKVSFWLYLKIGIGFILTKTKNTFYRIRERIMNP